MKQKRLDSLRRAQADYHRTNPWRLSTGGLYIPHSYNTPESLSWWDDVGFVINGRRTIVWWQHPRNVYKDAIEDQTWAEVGEGPEDNWLTEGGTKIYRRVGRSRKKLVGTSLREPSAARSAYHERLTAARTKLQTDGIDFEVRPTWKWKRLSWAMSVSLVVPMEVRNEVELAAVAALAKRLIRQETTLAKEFPDACYGREDWLRDQQAFNAQTAMSIELPASN